jgi:Ca-activated chloride channel family protein
MLRRSVLVVLLVVLSAALVTPAQPPASEVSVRFVAFDAQGNAVEPLGPEDVRLEVDGRARPLKGVRRPGAEPIALVVAVDTSVSQARSIEGAKAAAAAFVSRAMRPGVDEFGVVSFTHEPTVEQVPTGDARLVRAALSRVEVVFPQGYVGGVIIARTPPRRRPLPGASAIWDAASFVSEGVLARAPAPARRALVIITDGVDTASRRKLDDAVEAALRDDVVVYAVGVGDTTSFDGVAKDDLRRLSERTGGRAFFPKSAEELTAVFAQVQAALLSHHVVTFDAPGPRRDGSLRKIKIGLASEELRRRGVRLAHPHGYFAK